VRSLGFPYTRLGAFFLPIVPVTITSRNVTFRTDAYVDSGAFYSIFRSELLNSLELRKEQGQLKMLKAADGKLIRSYLFRLTLEIGTVKLRPLIAFSDQLNVGFNLLGRHTVFSSFDEVAFNERRKTVSFRLSN
jgi:hypothetical protein